LHASATDFPLPKFGIVYSNDRPPSDPMEEIESCFSLPYRRALTRATVISHRDSGIGNDVATADDRRCDGYRQVLGVGGVASISAQARATSESVVLLPGMSAYPSASRNVLSFGAFLPSGFPQGEDRHGRAFGESGNCSYLVRHRTHGDGCFDNCRGNFTTDGESTV
jgi:hypothetical protein